MNYIILSFLIIISIEIIDRNKYSYLIRSLLVLNKKTIDLILNKIISDHWKEKIIPSYSIKMMKLSLEILLISFSIIFLFFFANIFVEEFIILVFSFNGILISILVIFLNAYIKNLIRK